jgi:hypothetical protein
MRASGIVHDGTAGIRGRAMRELRLCPEGRKGSGIEEA